MQEREYSRFGFLPHLIRFGSRCKVTKNGNPFPNFAMQGYHPYHGDRLAGPLSYASTGLPSCYGTGYEYWQPNGASSLSVRGSLSPGK
jgi:hypothetical protein